MSRWSPCYWIYSFWNSKTRHFRGCNSCRVLVQKQLLEMPKMSFKHQLDLDDCLLSIKKADMRQANIQHIVVLLYADTLVYSFLWEGELVYQLPLGVYLWSA